MFGTFLAPTQAKKKTGRRFIAWIDGVGAWLILTGDTVSIGRVTSPGIGLLAPKKKSTDEADISVMADLSRKHATLQRVGESYVLAAHGRVAVQDRPFNDQMVIPDRCEFELNESVRFGFSLPTPLSTSARLTFASQHRPNIKVDGIILMSQSCLLGRGDGHHIPCPQWKSSVVLAQTERGIAVRSRDELFVDSRLAKGRTDISAGQIVSGPDFRFRIEELD
jgi:hypothetical protein